MKSAIRLHGTIRMRKPQGAQGSLQLNLPHTMAKRYVRYDNKRGVGGISEEVAISQAIRNLREKYRNTKVVIEVVNCMQVQPLPEIGKREKASYLFPVPSLLQEASLHIRVLTRADRFSEPALRQIMQSQPPHMPVIALNLSDAEKNAKLKHLRPLVQTIIGAGKVTSGRVDNYRNAASVVVCGLPNAGKSSLILPLTVARTKQVKNKGAYHLPKINAKPGWTLGIKSHAMEVRGQSDKSPWLISLLDTPGLRPRADFNNIDRRTKARLYAYGNMAPKGEEFDVLMERGEIIKEIWLGLANYHFLHNQNETAADFPYPSPLALFEAHKQKMLEMGLKNVTGKMAIQSLIKLCNEGSGGYDGMVMILPTDDERTLAGSPNDTPPPTSDLKNNVSFHNVENKNSLIVAMNKAAVVLQDVGKGNKTIGEWRKFQLQYQSSASLRPETTNTNHRDAVDNGRHPPRETHLAQRGKINQAGTSSSVAPGPNLKRTDVASAKNTAAAANPSSYRKKTKLTPTMPKMGQRLPRYPVYDVDGNEIVVVLPERQRRIDCMICAGFAKRSKGWDMATAKERKKQGLVQFRGTYYPRMLMASDQDLREFFSRVQDCFADRSYLVEYLCSQSLIRTLAVKHKIRSRHKTMLKFAEFFTSRKTWYIPSEKRQKRFQNHWHPPFLPIDCSCTNKAACSKVKEAGDIDAEDLYLMPQEYKDAVKITKKKSLSKRSKSTSRKRQDALATAKYAADKAAASED